MKRYVTIAEYQRQTGLSYATVRHMCNTGQIKYITCEGGNRKIDTMSGVDLKMIIERLDCSDKKLDKSEKLLTALCKQLNTNV